MGRKRNTMYEDAARTTLDELGGGPVRKGDLVKAVEERYPEIAAMKYAYNYVVKAVNESTDFDTSTRGCVSLVGATEAPAAPAVEPDYSEIGELVSINKI